ncbi:MAG: hydrogenase maturation protease [Pseudonocardiaceae bacterium]
MNASPVDPGGRVLVIGYGNSLRGDDGAGWHAAAALAGAPWLAGADVLACHQLAPELAEDIAHARLVVLIDACDDGAPPGTVSVRRVEPGYPPVPTCSHNLEPAALVSLAETLYGGSPPMFLVTVTGAFFGYRDRLSPAVRQALPEITDTIDFLQAQHAPGLRRRRTPSESLPSSRPVAAGHKRPQPGADRG